jgi:hypothetical protein
MLSLSATRGLPTVAFVSYGFLVLPVAAERYDSLNLVYPLR